MWRSQRPQSHLRVALQIVRLLPKGKVSQSQSLLHGRIDRMFVDDTCPHDSTMRESYILRVFPDSDKSIVDLLPYGQSRMPKFQSIIAHIFLIVTGLFRTSKTTRFYWAEDVIKIGALLEAIHLDVGRGTPGAAEDLQLFKQERLSLVKGILEVRVVFDACSSHTFFYYY